MKIHLVLININQQNDLIIFKLMLIRFVSNLVLVPSLLVVCCSSLFTYACLVQVVDVMKDNLDKVLERDTKLTTLENRAGKCNEMHAIRCCSFC